MLLLIWIKKLILFPVLVLIQLAGLACKIAIDLASYIAGPLLLFAAGCDLYCLIKGRMQDVLILSIILTGIFLFVILSAIIEELLLDVKNVLRKAMG